MLETSSFVCRFTGRDLVGIRTIAVARRVLEAVLFPFATVMPNNKTLIYCGETGLPAA
jgi:hypothetical protein